MIRIIPQVQGMRCGMCEAHVNDAVRRALPVKEITSSHGKGQTVIIAERDIDDERLRKVIHDTGYDVTDIRREPYEQKQGLFSFLHK